MQCHSHTVLCISVSNVRRCSGGCQSGCHSSMLVNASYLQAVQGKHLVSRKLACFCKVIQGGRYSTVDFHKVVGKNSSESSRFRTCAAMCRRVQKEWKRCTANKTRLTYFNGRIAGIPCVCIVQGIRFGVA